MQVNFDTVLKTIEGKPFQELKNPETSTPGNPKGDGEFVDVTLKVICVRALRTPLEEDKSITADVAFKRLELARRIWAGGEQKLDPAEAVLFRDRAAKLFGIEVSGQVYELLK